MPKAIIESNTFKNDKGEAIDYERFAIRSEKYPDQKVELRLSASELTAVKGIYLLDGEPSTVKSTAK